MDFQRITPPGFTGYYDKWYNERLEMIKELEEQLPPAAIAQDTEEAKEDFEYMKRSIESLKQHMEHMKPYLSEHQLSGKKAELAKREADAVQLEMRYLRSLIAKYEAKEKPERTTDFKTTTKGVSAFFKGVPVKSGGRGLRRSRRKRRSTRRTTRQRR